MSAPNTNVETQEHEHRTPLLGIRGSLIYAAVLLGAFLVWVFYLGSDDAPVQEPAAQESTLDGYNADGYEPGGNATGTVSGEMAN